MAKNRLKDKPKGWFPWPNTHAEPLSPIGIKAANLVDMMDYVERRNLIGYIQDSMAH